MSLLFFLFFNQKNHAEHITYKCNTAIQACNGITNIYIKGLGMKAKGGKRKVEHKTYRHKAKR